MKRNKLLYFFIILFPIIDLITSIETRNNISLTLGIIIKGLFFLYAIYYLLFLSTSKYKKISLWYLFLIFVFLCLYFGFKIDLISTKYIFNEGKNLFKILFLPVIFVFMLNYFSEFGFDKKRFIKLMVIILFEYTILMLIPLCLNLAYNSYSFGLQGYIGWFYSANEMSMIMILLLPFIYYLYNKKYNFLVSLPVIFVLSSIGTKGVLIGTLSVCIMALITFLIYFKGKINSYVVGSFLTLLFAFIFMFFVNNTTTENVEMMAEFNNYSFDVETIDDIDDEAYELLSFVLNGRDKFFYNTIAIYKKSYSIDYLITGMGFSNYKGVVEDDIFSKLIEIDFIDLFFRTGILSIIIVLLPFIFIFLKVIKYLISKDKKRNNIILVFAFSILIALVVAASLIQGHVLNYPGVSIYLILNMMFIMHLINDFKLKKVNYKNVSILALHLGIGGVENVICNQANMLSKNYNVEIISLYKNEKVAFELNDNVKVKYLMNTISNRKELKKSMEGLNNVSFFKEFFKSISILFNKKKLIRKAVLISSSGIIISSRKEFSKILGYYAKDDVITISEEHNHHNNDKKYIRSVVSSCKNIDYLLPASLELTNFYNGKVDSKVNYIPNSLNYIPSKINNLDNKRIVAIGRLVKEKNYSVLLDVISVVVKKDKDITLDIYGDGPQRKLLENKIKDLNLSNNVKLMGYCKPDNIKNILNDYSLTVCTSLHESFGISLLEAMSFGIPCITFEDAKGPLEFVNNDNGMIVKRDVIEMSNAIVNLLSDKKLLSKKSKCAYEKAKEYSYDEVASKLNSLINDAVKNVKKIHTRVLFVSSMGGHLNELLQLNKLFKDYKYEVITEKTNINIELENKYKMKFLLCGNKHKLFKYVFFIVPVNIIKSSYYVIKFRPDAVITTGAHSAVAVSIFGKIKGAKLIYIETFANLTSKTLTGRILHPIADVFVVQWKSMLNFYPDAEYWGWLF